jgi:hypothetical protein
VEKGEETTVGGAAASTGNKGPLCGFWFWEPKIPMAGWRLEMKEMLWAGSAGRGWGGLWSAEGKEEFPLWFSWFISRERGCVSFFASRGRTAAQQGKRGEWDSVCREMGRREKTPMAERGSLVFQREGRPTWFPLSLAKWGRRPAACKEGNIFRFRVFFLAALSPRQEFSPPLNFSP